MPAIFMGSNPIFLRAQTVADDNESQQHLIVCADRTCNASFYDDRDGWAKALKHATLKHGWRDGRVTEEDDDEHSG